MRDRGSKGKGARLHDTIFMLNSFLTIQHKYSMGVSILFFCAYLTSRGMVYNQLGRDIHNYILKGKHKNVKKKRKL